MASPTPQTPPTDRPLTAGDARMMEQIAHNLCSLHDFDVALVAGLERFAKAVITEYERARPATSAASEGEGEPMRLVSDRVLADALYWMARGYERVHSMPRVSDTELANKIEGAKAALGRARDAAALSSPPVSERERELEGALRGALPYLEVLHSTSNGKEARGIVWRVIQRAADALTAQPAGEGK